MQLIAITPQKLARLRSGLIRFVWAFGERRIAKKSIHWLSQFSPDELLLEGTQILAAIEKRRLIGLSCVSGFGRNITFVVIHPAYRNSHLGTRMMAEHLQRLGSLTANVACDNAPSMKLCKNAGLLPCFVFSGPTGKPTLRFVGGSRYLKEGESSCLIHV